MSFHDPQLIDLYEVVGSHFVDVLFNAVHDSARKSVGNAGARSLTEAYQNDVHSYVTSVKTQSDSYRKTVQLLHTACRDNQARLSFSSYPEFVDRIVGTLAPRGHFDVMVDRERDELLGAALCELITALGTFATTPDMLRRIIDNRQRDAQVAIRMLQDHAVATLIATRDRMRNEFLGQAGQSRGSVDSELVLRLKKAIKRLAMEKVVLEENAEALQGKLERSQERLQSERELRATERAKFTHLVQMLNTRPATGPEAWGETTTFQAVPPPLAFPAEHIGPDAAQRPNSQEPLGDDLGSLLREATGSEPWNTVGADIEEVNDEE
jgi:hypothetical protein